MAIMADDRHQLPVSRPDVGLWRKTQKLPRVLTRRIPAFS